MIIVITIWFLKLVLAIYAYCLWNIKSRLDPTVNQSRCSLNCFATSDRFKLKAYPLSHGVRFEAVSSGRRNPPCCVIFHCKSKNCSLFTDKFLLRCSGKISVYRMSAASSRLAAWVAELRLNWEDAGVSINCDGKVIKAHSLILGMR